jgi:hypothetical protein
MAGFTRELGGCTVRPRRSRSSRTKRRPRLKVTCDSQKFTSKGSCMRVKKADFGSQSLASTSEKLIVFLYHRLEAITSADPSATV